MSTHAVVVTGGSVGIGRATVRHFLAAGARVYSLARRPCPEPEAVSVLVDLAEGASVVEALEALRATLGATPGRLTLVHNAAVVTLDRADDFDPEASLRAMRINVVSPAELTAGLLPLMAPGSSIVFVGSTLSEKGVPGRLTYVASKHALVGLMRATVQDLFGRGIHATCVCPGFTDTEMLRPLLEADPAFERAVLEMISFHRLLAPDEVAELIAFAARSPALNGAVLHANLGQREA